MTKWVGLGAVILIGCGSGLDASGLGFDEPEESGVGSQESGYPQGSSGRLGIARDLSGYASADAGAPVDAAIPDLDSGASDSRLPTPDSFPDASPPPCGPHFDPVASAPWTGCPAPGVPGNASTYTPQLLAAEIARVRAQDASTRAESVCGGVCTCLRPQNALLCHGGPAPGLYVAAFGSTTCLPCPASIDTYPGRWW